MTDKAYKVFLTPLIDEMTYGAEVEISDYVIASSMGDIKKNTDSDDYVIGEYLLGSVDLTCANFNGEFNDADPRSYFRYKRDQAKVRVEYYSSLTDYTISFKGLVNEEGTSGDDDTIKLKVIALESILRKVIVAAGLIADGVLYSDAIKTLLNRSQITSVLTYSAANISVELDLAVDSGGAFDNISTWEAVKQLLIASNSVIYIDNQTIHVKPRSYDTDNVVYFYGPGDTLDRENIIDISEYNNGAHRIFNSIKVNNTIYTDSNSETWFGFKQKQFTFDFVTDTDKEFLIARTLVEQFRYPRIEFEMTVPTDLANQVGFFDTIGVSHPLRARPCCGYNASLWDVSKWDTTTDVYNIDFGGLVIDGRLAFQMIARKEDPKSFTTTIKCRGRGKTFDDGMIIYWASIYDQSLWDVSNWG